MAVGFRAGSNTGNSQSVTSINVPVPTGVAADDVIVIWLGQWEGGFNPTITPPSGFASAGTWSSGDGLARNSVWWKRATGADSGNYAFSWTGGAGWTTGQAVAFTGVVTSGNPIGSQFTSAVGTFGSCTALNLTVGAGDGLVWCCYNDSSGAHTPPTGWTETADVDSGATAYLLSAGGGSISSTGASISSSSSAGVAMVALTAAGGGGGSVATPGPVVAPRPAVTRAAVW